MSQEQHTKTPRLLTRAQAAKYCNVSPSTFSRWVGERILPPPLPRTSRWDQRAIDIALNQISGIEKPQANALDKWKEARGARQA